MPRYFFDTRDGVSRRDEVGSECADFETARREAMASLLEIAQSLLPTGGDQQAFTVLVRDAVGVIVYTATLTFAGLKVNSRVV